MQVVACIRGSDTDVFCQNVGLIQLDPAKNPFITCHQYPGWTQFWVARKVRLLLIFYIKVN